MNYNTLKHYFENTLSKSELKPKYQLSSEKYKVINAYEDDYFIGFDVILDRDSAFCQHCGCVISKIKDYKYTYVNYDLIGDKTVILKIKKKLFYCNDCNKSTIAVVDEVGYKSQKSNNIKELIIKELKSNKQCYTQVGRRYHISTSNIIYNFDNYELLKKNLEAVQAINIDEVRIIPSVGNYQCVIADADTGEVIEILKDRYKPTVLEYLSIKLPNLKIISQDFWDTYKSCAKAVNAEVVVDKFHFVRFVMWAYNRTRVAIQKQKNLKLMKTWKLQNKSRLKLNKLSKRYVDKVIGQDKQLGYAYKAKEFFLHISKINDINEFKQLISKWKAYVLKHELKEFYFIITTLDNWNREIENMITMDYSNGKAERINRDIKQTKNQAFGFRNIKRTKKLIMLRHSYPTTAEVFA